MNKEHIGSNFDEWLKEQGIDFFEEYKRLKAENEELKNKLFDEGLIRENCKYYKQVCSENTQLIRLDEEVKVWKANAINHEQKEIEYKQALEDVRDITKKYYLSDKKLLATGIEINPYGAIIDIQDKINEVLKDENH